jgi:transposase InsO family protein
VILDLFSRYVVGWMVAPGESAELARKLIQESLSKQGVLPGQLHIHADNGPSMTSKTLALKLADLGVTKSHSRPYVSDDNPFPESQFKTIIYRASMTIDKHTLALVSIVGSSLDVLGALYLAYDLLGGEHGPLRTLTRGVTYGLLFGAGYGVALGPVFGLASGAAHGITLAWEFSRASRRRPKPGFWYDTVMSPFGEAASLRALRICMEAHLGPRSAH